MNQDWKVCDTIKMSQWIEKMRTPGGEAGSDRANGDHRVTQRRQRLPRPRPHLIRALLRQSLPQSLKPLKNNQSKLRQTSTSAEINEHLLSINPATALWSALLQGSLKRGLEITDFGGHTLRFPPGNGGLKAKHDVRVLQEKGFEQEWPVSLLERKEAAMEAEATATATATTRAETLGHVVPSAPAMARGRRAKRQSQW